MNNQLIATLHQAVIFGILTKSEDEVELDGEVRGAFGNLLTEEELVTLVQLINPPKTHRLYSKCFNRSDEVGKMIGEALHQGLDGWEPDEVVVIERFLQDISFALSVE